MSNVSAGNRGVREFGLSRRGTVKGKDLEVIAMARELGVVPERVERATPEHVESFDEFTDAALELENIDKSGDTVVSSKPHETLQEIWVEGASRDSAPVATEGTEVRSSASEVTDRTEVKDLKKIRRNGFKLVGNKMILLKKSLAVIACGSENTTSDRDYTKVLPGVTKKWRLNQEEPI